MEQLVKKTTTIMIADGNRLRRYSSPSEVPADLRRRLQQAVLGPNAETLLITNEKGRELLEAQEGPVKARMGVRRVGPMSLWRTAWEVFLVVSLVVCICLLALRQ